MEIKMTNELAPMIYDGETKELRPLDPERHRMASFLHQQALMGTMVTALAIKKIFDDKYYLELGCTTKAEYCETMLSFSVRQAEKYYAVASRFQSVIALPEDANSSSHNGENVNSSLQIEGNANSSSHQFAQLGITKLYQLLTLPDKNLQELIETGKTSVRDLDDVTMEDLHESSARKVMLQMKELRRELTGKISRLEQENLKLKSEASTAEDRMKEAREMWEKGAQLESKYIGAERTLEGKRRSIARAHELLSELMREVTKIEINLDDPETEQRRCLDLVRNLEWAHSNARMQFDILVLNANLED